MTKNELIANLKANRWYQDRFGHWRFRTTEGKDFRIKANQLSVRFEVKNGKGWINLSSVTIYYKDIIVILNKKGERALKLGSRACRMVIDPCM